MGAADVSRHHYKRQSSLALIFIAGCITMDRSDQIRAGIAASRERGTDWGRSGRERAIENAIAADNFAKNLRQLIIELMSFGPGGPPWIAFRLNRMGVPTARGGRWHAFTVVRLIERLGDLESDVAAARSSNAGSWITSGISFHEWRILRGLVQA